MDGLPRLVVTGASGFVGRHVLDSLKEDFLIFGLARRSQARSGAPVHPNILWYQVDVGDRGTIQNVFRRIRDHGGAETVIHLAAHHDFSGDEHQEYWRTSVHGLRNILDVCRDLGVRHFVFGSSLAACRFPRPGEVVSESNPADGQHIYARAKRAGEEMLEEYRDHFRSHIVRFAALYSDWCEYFPLFMFLRTWLSESWCSRILGGRGQSAIPYLHVLDVPPFFRSLLSVLDEIEPGQVLHASPDGAVSHRELFEVAHLSCFGQKTRPLLLPRPLCGVCIRIRDVLGTIAGETPFERPWMARYVDRQLVVSSLRTRQLLTWSPRPRLGILRRMPFLIENMKADPVEWHRRNRAALKQVELRINLRIYQLLERHEAEICGRYSKRLRELASAERLASYRNFSEEQLSWIVKQIFRHLANAVRTHEKGVIISYCRDLAAQRFREGFTSREVCDALELLNQTCFAVLRKDPEAEGLRDAIHDHVTMTLRVGCDQAQDVFEALDTGRAH